MMLRPLLSLSALALAASTVSAYLDTSPFYLLSTSELPLKHASNKHISTADAITSEISHSLVSHCPSDYYILVSQPGLTSDDYAQYHRTRRTASGSRSIKSSLSIPEVVGEIDTEALAKQLSKSCQIPRFEIDATSTGTGRSIPASYDDFSRVVLTLQLPAVPTTTTMRDEALSLNDDLLSLLLDRIPTKNYTIVYTATPGASIWKQEEDRQYEMDPSDIQESLHMDLKRAVGVATSATNQNNKQQQQQQQLVEGGLFHRYQFFTPGIFMGFLVGFLLLLILYVAISGLASLQVTYAAFDKEQGQLAATSAKKAQ